MHGSGDPLVLMQGGLLCRDVLEREPPREILDPDGNTIAFAEVRDAVG